MNFYQKSNLEIAAFYSQPVIPHREPELSRLLLRSRGKNKTQGPSQASLSHLLLFQETYRFNFSKKKEKGKHDTFLNSGSGMIVKSFCAHPNRARRGDRRRASADSVALQFSEANLCIVLDLGSIALPGRAE